MAAASGGGRAGNGARGKLELYGEAAAGGARVTGEGATGMGTELGYVAEESGGAKGR